MVPRNCHKMSQVQVIEIIQSSKYSSNKRNIYCAESLSRKYSKVNLTGVNHFHFKNIFSILYTLESKMSIVVFLIPLFKIAFKQLMSLTTTVYQTVCLKHKRIHMDNTHKHPRPRFFSKYIFVTQTRVPSSLSLRCCPYDLG